jgi:tetratricopeptide (TPR) repeat protein
MRGQLTRPRAWGASHRQSGVSSKHAGGFDFIAARAAGFSGAAALLCIAGCNSAHVPAKDASEANAPYEVPAPPPWLPAYSAKQLELVRPVSVAIKVPAFHTYPDLERFGYSSNRKMEDLREGLKFTKMVATVLEDSPRFYALTDATPDLANTVAQYGPPGTPEADGWHIVKRGADGIGVIMNAEVSPEARAVYDRGAKAYTAHQFPDAIAAFKEANQKSPAVPAIRVAYAEALQASGDVPGALAAYKEAVDVDPTYSTAHRGLAEMLFKTGKIEDARREVAEALAYHPGSAQAFATATEISGGKGIAGERVKPFDIFIDVDSVGAIHVGSSGGSPAGMYASCRAVLRYEPDIRSALFKQAPDTPYYLSMVEEVVCIESAIGAYVADHLDESGAEKADDPNLETLLQIAKTEGLSGYAMYEILGTHRPERARTAPGDVHRAMIDYIDRHVLGGAPVAAASYSASL